MLIRRNLAIALTTVALCLPAVSACGFEAATNRPYTPAVGANAQDGPVDVLGAVIVSGTDGSGTFVASLANNDATDADSLDSLAPGTGSDVTAGEFAPIEIAPRSLVNLATDGGVALTGGFGVGNFVTVVLGFTSGGRVEIDVPVVPAEGDYAGLDTSGSTPTETPTDVPSETPTDAATESQ